MAKKPPLRHALTPDEVHQLQSEFIARVAPESHFHLALNQLGNVRVVVKDAAGRFVWVSDNASRRHGFAEPSEMVGLDDVAINPPRLVKKYRRDDLQVLRSGRPLLGRIELAFDERGMLKWHVTNKLPLYDHGGACIGLIATIQEYPGVQNLPVFGGAEGGRRTRLRPPRRTAQRGRAGGDGRRLPPPDRTAIPQCHGHEPDRLYHSGAARRSLPAAPRRQRLDRQDRHRPGVLRPKRLHAAVSPTPRHNPQRFPPNARLRPREPAVAGLALADHWHVPAGRTAGTIAISFGIGALYSAKVRAFMHGGKRD